MYLHEFQTKSLLKSNNILVPKSFLINNHDDVTNVLTYFSSEYLVLKAQIHSGARFEYGGILFIKNNYKELNQAITKLLYKNLITNQTGPDGKKINKILIEEKLNIKNEIYMSFSIDRDRENIVFLISLSGGSDIEKKNNDRFLKMDIDLSLGPCDYHIRKTLFFLNISDQYYDKFNKLISNLFNIFTKYNMLLLEINPLVINKEQLLCLDAKSEIDDNALCKNKHLIDFYDPSQENVIETEARKNDLSYISLDGNIGCMVNGAGLAMATMDLIKFHNGSPANFLDIGGDATEERVFQAIKIILLNKNVKCIFVNIFGGIVRCDLIANSLISVYQKLNISMPVLVRLVGNMSKEALSLIKNSDCSIETESDFLTAVKKIITLSGEKA